MNKETEKIYNDVKSLPPHEHADLLEKIIESFDTEQDEEIKKAWAEEAERRLAIHKSGENTSLSEEEMFKRIEKENTK